MRYQWNCSVIIWNIRFVNLSLSGDIISVFDLIGHSNLQKLSSFCFNKDQNVINIQVLKHFSSVLNHLLEEKSMTSWLDLLNLEFCFVRARFIGILQEVGIALLESSNSETTLRSKNFGMFDIFTNNSWFLLYLLFISLELTQFLHTLRRNSPHLVLLEVTKVDTLFTIMVKGNFFKHDTTDVSKE